MSIKVLGGDFRQGRAHFDEVGFLFVNVYGAREPVPFGAVEAVHVLGTEERTKMSGRVAGAAGGGLAGAGAGALAGGAGGPIGAAVGALIGAFLFSSKRNYMTCRIDLRDGRSAIAVATLEVWTALEDLIQRAPVVPVPKPITDASPPPPQPSVFDRAWRLLPGTVFPRRRWWRA